ncbi:MAG: lipid A biosynthesis lauroyl acyltransferase [Pseudomonadota bacterium]
MRQSLGRRIRASVRLVLAQLVFSLLSALGPDRASAFGGWVARKLGRLFAQNKVARENIARAFPEKSEVEKAAILRGAWDNLGRTGAEYPHLRAIMDYDHHNPVPGGRIDVIGAENFIRLRDDGKPGMVFTGHFANWEISGVLAARYGLDVTAVYRAPNDPGVRRLIEKVRSETMGGLEASRPGAAFVLRDVLEEGGHLGMLVDQHFSDGRPVVFLGRPALVNPIVAKLVRHFDCPLVGARAIRRDGARFTLEMTAPLDLPRDARGRVDEVATTRMMSEVVEGWVREHPEQWLWMHRRWRPTSETSKRA